MRRTGLALAVTLALLTAGCGGDDPESGSGAQQPADSPTTSAAPTPDEEAQLRALAEDALALSRRAEVLEPDSGIQSFLDTLFIADSDVARPGTVQLPTSFTIRYPGFDARTDARGIVRLLKKHGFGATYGYRWEEIKGGLVQKSSDLRCQMLVEEDDARLNCVTYAFLEHIEYDVADALTSLYVDETGAMDLGCWELLYANTEHDELPHGALLQTGVCEPEGQFGVYVDDGDGWELVARARRTDRPGPELVAALCSPEHRDAFDRMGACSSPPA